MAAFQYLESIVFIQYKRKVELCQSQQYVPLSSFVFCIELEIPMDWIDENTLKLEIEDPINKLSTIAVCKTIKKSMEFYLTDGQQVESVKEKDLDVQILHQIYEKVEEVTGLQKDQFQQGIQK